MGCLLKSDCLLPPSRYRGVIVVIVTLIVYIPVGGQFDSFGVFVEKLNEDFCPHDCLLFLSWVGALTFGTNRLCCWIIVSLQNRLSTCVVFFAGVILSSSAMAFSSLITDLNWLFLTYCALFGVGSSMVMNSPYEIIESYFPSSHKFHVLATSVINIGSPVGSILIYPLSAYLDDIETHTWRDTMKIYAALILTVGVLASFFMRKKTGEDGEDEKTKYEDLDKTTETQTDHHSYGCTAGLIIDVHLWIIGILLVSFAIYIPKIHFIQYMETLHFNLESAAMCMSYAGAAEAVFGLAIALTGDFISKHLMFLYGGACALISVASGLLVVFPYHTYIIIYCVVHGAVDGITMTLLFSATALLAPTGTVKKYIWSGTFFVNGMGQILGIPLAGYVYDVTKSYVCVFYAAAGVFGLAALLFITLAVRLKLRQARPVTSPEGREIVTSSTRDSDNGKADDNVDVKSE